MRVDHTTCRACEQLVGGKSFGCNRQPLQMWRSFNHIGRIERKAAVRKQPNKRFFASFVPFVVKMVPVPGTGWLH